MARLTLAAVAQDMAVQLADNTSGAITPAKLRGVLQNMLDSLNPVTAMAWGSPASVAVPLTSTPSRLPVTFFTDSFSDDPNVLSGRVNPNGDLISLSAVGQLSLSFNINYAGTTGADFNLYIYRNAAALPFIVRLSTTGLTNVQSADFNWLIQDTAVSDTYSIWAASQAATGTLTVSGIAIKGIQLPTLT